MIKKGITLSRNIREILYRLDNSLEVKERADEKRPEITRVFPFLSSSHPHALLWNELTHEHKRARFPANKYPKIPYNFLVLILYYELHMLLIQSLSLLSKKFRIYLLFIQ